MSMLGQADGFFSEERRAPMTATQTAQREAYALANELAANGWNNMVLDELFRVCTENEIFCCEEENGVYVNDDFFQVDE
jgi:hypothetical protein